MEEKDFILERYELTMERIASIVNEETVSVQFRDYFQKTAKFLLEVEKLWKKLQEKTTENCSLEALKEENAYIYNDILGANYSTSFANPVYAISVLGEELGKILCFLYAELRGEIAYVYEDKLLYLTVYNELFIEIYNCFEETESPSYKELREIVYWFVNDYCEVFVADWVEGQINPQKTFARDIIFENDLSDVRYLYQYGEYISEYELEISKYFNAFSQEDLENMAKSYVEIYLKQCTNRAQEKRILDISYQIGSERLIKHIIEQLEMAGKQVTIYRKAVSAIVKEKDCKLGFYGTDIDGQYSCDHQDDQGIFLNKKIIERKLEVIKNTYEQWKESVFEYSIPFVLKIESENKAEFEKNEVAISLTEKQESYLELYENKLEQLTKQYRDVQESLISIYHKK